MKYPSILRFRFSKEVADILETLPDKSNFVRQAVEEKMIREKIISKTKTPF